VIVAARDFADNVFIGKNLKDPPSSTIEPNVTNERNTISIFGDGAIEMVAREITRELHGQRDAARLRAAVTKHDERVRLKAKEIPFGYITVHADGSYSTDE